MVANLFAKESEKRRQGPARCSRLDERSEEHWPKGVKIKMTLESAKPKGKRLGGKW